MIGDPVVSVKAWHIYLALLFILAIVYIFTGTEVESLMVLGFYILALIGLEVSKLRATVTGLMLDAMRDTR